MTKKPLGIRLLGFLFALKGAWNLLTALVLISLALSAPSSIHGTALGMGFGMFTLIFGGAMALLTGVGLMRFTEMYTSTFLALLNALAGLGLLRLKQWSRRLALIGITGSVCLLFIHTTLFPDSIKMLLAGGRGLWFFGLGWVWNIFVVGYLLKPNIRALFKSNSVT